MKRLIYGNVLIKFQSAVLYAKNDELVSYLSKGQGLTRDTLELVTDADDLCPHSREMKKPHKNPRTRDASPVTTAIVTA